jgi:CRISPR type IV-associated protein Csf3
MSRLAACHPNLRGKDAYYARLAMVPLRVTAILGTPYIPAEPPDRLHLDAVLSWAVVNTQPYPLACAGPAIVVPLPLACLWTSPEGWPLWAASDLVPVGEALPSREQWHKRYPQDRADWDTRGRAITSRGRWKEYRVPVQTIACGAVVGLCLGHHRTVQALLDQVPSVGKKSGMGYGQVIRWAVEPQAISRAEALTQILRARPVPGRYAEGHAPGDVRTLARRGWTPPYWYLPTHDLCVEPER